MRESLFLLKKRPWHRCFPVNFMKFLRTPFLTESPVVVSVNNTDLSKYADLSQNNYFLANFH